MGTGPSRINNKLKHDISFLNRNSNIGLYMCADEHNVQFIDKSNSNKFFIPPQLVCGTGGAPLDDVKFNSRSIIGKSQRTLYYNTTFGFLCPAETPEGQSVGVVKNLAYMTHLTTYSDSRCLYDYVKNDICELTDIKPIELYDKVKIIINGNIIGYAINPV